MLSAGRRKMPAIKELEIKMGKRTEDIKVRLLALEQDNYIMGWIGLHYGTSSFWRTGNGIEHTNAAKRR
jgi:hypothetical protein